MVRSYATQRNATQRNATQRNATQRNATQRNATQRNATPDFCLACFTVCPVPFLSKSKLFLTAKLALLLAKSWLFVYLPVFGVHLIYKLAALFVDVAGFLRLFAGAVITNKKSVLDGVK